MTVESFVEVDKIRITKYFEKRYLYFKKVFLGPKNYQISSNT